MWPYERKRIALLYVYEMPEDWATGYEPAQVLDRNFVPYLTCVQSFADYEDAKCFVREIIKTDNDWGQRNPKGFHWTRGQSQSGHNLVFQLTYNNIQE